MGDLIFVLIIIAYLALTLAVLWWCVRIFGLTLNVKKLFLLVVISTFSYFITLAAIPLFVSVASSLGFTPSSEDLRNMPSLHVNSLIFILNIVMFLEFGILLFLPFRLLGKIGFLKYVALCLILFTIINFATWFCFSFARSFPNPIK